MSILTYHLYRRTTILWHNRHLPAYLGPPVWALIHLLILFVVNSIVLFALTILLLRVLYGLATNVTTIEGWEIERHETLVERSQRMGGYIYAKGGQQMRIRHQEFPYDVGIWKNISQAMGTDNVLMWLLPFAGSPSVETAGVWEVNGFEDKDKTWPPPDPDKLPCVWQSEKRSMKEYDTVEEQIIAFKQRQQADILWRGRRKHSNFNVDGHSLSENSRSYEKIPEREKEDWINEDGDCLQDYGVDEEAEDISQYSPQLRKQF
ncbi:hypothetical protein K3495_g5245 [Podosphaera aphanis]|nr:hypothetical protein K3495_g5245 [Podosphaera aphanis]